MKQVILTGLRANNDLTLGNYFGGILPMIDMAKTRSDEFQINMFIPDLHSFTTPIDHGGLYSQILQTAKLFVAAGLPIDNSSIKLYRQSYISAHSEMTWILSNFTGFGEMLRMTQFKDKTKFKELLPEVLVHIDDINSLLDEVEKGFEAGDDLRAKKYGEIIRKNNDFLATISQNQVNVERATVGLFGYPILMATDILLYGASYVPVGDDQTQHLEFTRDIAERMNTRFSDVFVVPEPVKKQHEFFGKDQGLRIMDLVDPTKKMSKSDEFGKGVIFLSDDPEAAAKKVMSATTDDKAYVRLDRQNQPGISNLLEILSLLRAKTLDETVKEFEGQTRYGDFKKIVADEVQNFLTDFQTKLADVSEESVHAKLESSEAAMNVQANATLLKVQKAVGLRPKA